MRVTSDEEKWRCECVLVKRDEDATSSSEEWGSCGEFRQGVGSCCEFRRGVRKLRRIPVRIGEAAVNSGEEWGSCDKFRRGVGSSGEFRRGGWAVGITSCWCMYGGVVVA